MGVNNQKPLLNLHIKNKFCGSVAFLIFWESMTWDDLKTLLENHFGHPCDLSTPIEDFQGERQLNKSPLTLTDTQNQNVGSN